MPVGLGGTVPPVRRFDLWVAALGSTILAGAVAGFFGWLYAIPAIIVMAIAVQLLIGSLRRR